MDPTDIPLFDLAEQRLAWTDRRQEALAQNIANVDTPHWQAKDIAPFAQTLAAVSGPALARTDPSHLAGVQDAAQMSLQAMRQDPHAPDGNGVSLDEQLTKVADTATAQQIATTLYKKYMDMFTLALGASH